MQKEQVGEHGKGETLTDPDDIKRNDELFKTFGMSVLISDKMSVNRSIVDFRHQDCLKKKYLRNLPRVSVIIIFNNEVLSMFKRTLHSLYNRTPHEMIEEVILVNDNSTFEYLYEPLQIYIEENFSGLIFKFLNLDKRHGLMKARIIGAKAARSNFLFLMEPHCEIAYNWLPPLIEPLLENRRTVTVPIIDYIEYNKLAHSSNGHGSRGSFNWNLEYKQLPKFPKDEAKLDPFPIPIMTGGIFMIRKDYFFEIGPYDEELLIWGAENLELSFKINLCGGRLLEIPCSRIGHAFRAYNKFRKHETGINFVAFNNKRITEVWLDEYKEFVYMRRPDLYKIDVGDLTKAKQIRDNLKCQPFKYFLDVVAPDLIKNFPPVVASFTYGTVRMFNTSLCLDTFHRKKGESLGLYECDKDSVNPRRNQNFQISQSRDLRLRFTETCMDAHNFSIQTCHLNKGNQFFLYDKKTQQIIQGTKCIEGNRTVRTVVQLKQCVENKMEQKWIWAFINETEFID